MVVFKYFYGRSYLYSWKITIKWTIRTAELKVSTAISENFYKPFTALIHTATADWTGISSSHPKQEQLVGRDSKTITIILVLCGSPALWPYKHRNTWIHRQVIKIHGFFTSRNGNEESGPVLLFAIVTNTLRTYRGHSLWQLQMKEFRYRL